MKEIIEPAWLRAHSGTTSVHPQELISICDTSPRPIDEVEDVGSAYKANEMGEDTENLNDLFNF